MRQQPSFLAIGRARRRRILAGVVLFPALLAGCSPGDAAGTATGPPAMIDGQVQEVSDQQIADAEHALREQGAIERINNGQPWRVDYGTAARGFDSDGELVNMGVSMVVSWDGAVSSNGPWVNLLCRGSVRIEREVLWHELRAISVIVSITDGSLLAIAPGAPEGSNPFVGQRGTLRSYVDPADHARQAPLPDCPPGMSDD